ncbi:MAG: hypothetical protein ACAI35_16535 [Candidatus Methylacidiphilales bacterium]|nr:hypothetical protein [Candidatus Methylacidiphilales bacterium]
MSSQRAITYKTSSAKKRGVVNEAPAATVEGQGNSLRDTVRYSSDFPVAAPSLQAAASVAMPSSPSNSHRLAADPRANTTFTEGTLSFAAHGYLTPGIHPSSFTDAERLLAFNDARRTQWQHLERFVAWVAGSNQFSCIYLDGGYVSRKAVPDDIDCILQSREPYGTAALESMIPFFSYGLERILTEYRVHLHFWAEGFPGGVQDFRMFFQYVRPRDAAESSLAPQDRKGILRLDLGERSVVPELSSDYPPSQVEPAGGRLPGSVIRSSTTARRRR